MYTKLKRIRFYDPRFGWNATRLSFTWSVASGRQLPPTAVGFIYKIIRASTESFIRNAARFGSVRLMWHGTTRTCTLGDNPKNLNFCTDYNCSLCQILQWGYSIAKANANGMLGKGIYFSPLSSKQGISTVCPQAMLTYFRASNYARNTSRSKYHALILNRVVVGNTYKTTHSQNYSTGPPAGYHSASAASGGGLVKFDETSIATRRSLETSANPARLDKTSASRVPEASRARELSRP
ncbi:hypothetical protein R3P38DRAFT_3368447 [Favolaschia claudopus]|uniref:PARP n=1 Tax=Favolaschia claudopus TaxID=2862362 RepID=A0AAW0A5W0_9AGAR